MNNKVILKILAIIIGLSIGLTILILVARDLAWQGKLWVETDFLRFSPYFSILKPQDRVVMTDTNYFKAEPIYFDLYLPRDFDKARLELEYINQYGYAILVGPNMKTGWDLKPMEDLPNAADAYKINSMEFDLKDKNINQGKLRFMISIPDMDDENRGIYLKKVRILLTRQPIWQQNIFENLFNYFKYVKNQY